MYNNILNNTEQSKENGIKLNANDDVVRVKGLDVVLLLCYDSDGNFIGKVPAF